MYPSSSSSLSGCIQPLPPLIRGKSSGATPEEEYSREYPLPVSGVCSSISVSDASVKVSKTIGVRVEYKSSCLVKNTSLEEPLTCNSPPNVKLPKWSNVSASDVMWVVPPIPLVPAK